MQIGADKEGRQMMERARLALEMYPEKSGESNASFAGLFSEDPSGFVRGFGSVLSERATWISTFNRVLAQSVGVAELLSDPGLSGQTTVDRLGPADCRHRSRLDSKLVRFAT